MKYLCIAILLTLLCASAANSMENQKHLFILSGQSNMARLDPGLSFTPTVEAAFGKDNVTIVKDAMSGQPISRWYKKWNPPHGDAPIETGDLYDRLMKKVNLAISDNNFSTVTFVWMQGERDALLENGEVYAASLRGLIAQLAEDLRRKDINLVIGRLSDFDLADEKYPHWTRVRKAQVEVAEAYPRGRWVDTDDLNDGLNAEGKLLHNDLHYSVDGYKAFGNRLAEACILLIRQ
ncbi:MAG: sialate O-acetylesterase [Puniceicoccaceae bacterium]